MGTNLAKYGSYTEEAAKAEAEEMSKGGGDYMKLEVGKSVVRVLPPPVGQRSPFVIVHQHYIKIPGADSPASFNCPRMMLHKPCPACAEVDRLRRSGNPVDYDTAGDYLPKLRVYAKVIDRAHPEMGPRTLAFGKLVKQGMDKCREDGDFTDPVDGFDIIITRTGTGKTDTKYDVRASRDNSPLADTEEQMNDWLSTMGDISMFARVPTAQEIARILQLPEPAAAPTGGTRRTAGAGTRRPSRTAQDDAGDVIDTTGEES